MLAVATRLAGRFRAQHGARHRRRPGHRHLEHRPAHPGRRLPALRGRPGADRRRRAEAGTPGLRCSSRSSSSGPTCTAPSWSARPCDALRRDLGLRGHSASAGVVPSACCAQRGSWCCPGCARSSRRTASRCAGYYRHFSSSSALQHTITEWAPSSVRSQPFFFIVLGAVLFVVLRQRARAGALCAARDRGHRDRRPAREPEHRLVRARHRRTRARGPRRALAGPSPSERRPRANRAIVRRDVRPRSSSPAAAAANSEAAPGSRTPIRSRAADIVARAAAANPALRVYANETFADWLLFEHPSLDGSVSSDIRYELLSDAQTRAHRGVRVAERQPTGAPRRPATGSSSSTRRSPPWRTTARAAPEPSMPTAHVVVLGERRRVRPRRRRPPRRARRTPRRPSGRTASRRPPGGGGRPPRPAGARGTGDR